MKSLNMKHLSPFSLLSLFLLLASFSQNLLAQGRDLASEIELERTLEDRIKPLVDRFDPAAIVRVNVSFKRISAPLPGTALDVSNFSGSAESGTLRDGEISSTTVTIFSGQSQIPNWLAEEIAMAMPSVRPKIDLKPFSPEAQLAMDKKQAADPVQAVQQAMITFSQQATSLLFGLGAILLFGITVGSGVAYFLQRKRTQETYKLLESRIIPALQNLGQGDSGSTSKTTVVQATLNAPVGGFQSSSGSHDRDSGSNEDIEGLSLEALEAVLSDCYWCHQDRYAAWLWSAMSAAQRKSIFASKLLDIQYLRWIQSLPRERMEEHLNPAYLNPAPLHHVSQHDLARWVEKATVTFHVLSPMRQKTLPVSLKTRLACAADLPDEKTKLPEFPTKTSPKRHLPFVQQFGDISPEDETTLLHNPFIVEDSIRPQIRSLVWLALRPLEYRQKILAEYSAESLAAAWTGSEEILARLAEALPEKKKNMLDGYLKVVEINKKTSVFSKLVDAGIETKSMTTETVKLAA